MLLAVGSPMFEPPPQAVNVNATKVAANIDNFITLSSFVRFTLN
ncbi:hypothetical protein NSMM_240043 [Nitrosomonas mobilis]|uniref:Uncharacterized protein n=1 Tax=Nitrosomonas mobilis TaxID=51642 RepID=A0A1G5SE06_9PROT|nr:hypothetical protein NSMM_240043 [Nitrosomonas mobilis]